MMFFTDSLANLSRKFVGAVFSNGRYTYDNLTVERTKTVVVVVVLRVQVSKKGCSYIFTNSTVTLKKVKL